MFFKILCQNYFTRQAKKTCLYNSNVQQNQQSKSLNHSTIMMNRSSLKVHNQTGY